MKQLEDENRRLKGLVADLTLDKHMLQEVLPRKVIKPAGSSVSAVTWLMGAFGVGSAHGPAGSSGWVARRTTSGSTAKDQTPLRTRLRELAAARPRFGYPRLHVLLRREGWKVNIKRVYRLYRLEGLDVRDEAAGRSAASHLRVVPAAPTAANERWSMDFMRDQPLETGARSGS